MSQDWPKVSKNERHGYEEPDVAPPPTPESAHQFVEEHGGTYCAADANVVEGFMVDFAKAQIAHLQAELQAAHKTVYDIQTVAYEANRLLEKRAEQAEARCRELEAELERVRKQGTDAVLDLKEQMQEMKIIHNDDLKAAEARCRVLEEALRKYWHCRHAWMIDCFCTKEARAALAPG